MAKVESSIRMNSEKPLFFPNSNEVYEGGLMDPMFDCSSESDSGATKSVKRGRRQSVVNNSLTMVVTNYILDHIRRYNLCCGDDLPSELKTRAELNVSRGVVREAFRSLEVVGIIQKGNGRSPRVGVLNGSFLTHMLLHGLSTKQVSYRQVLELRASIEVKAAELAARRRTSIDIQRLRAAVEGMKQSVTALNSFVEHDLDFHDLINATTGNPLIEIIGNALHESMKETMRAGLRKRKGPDQILQVAKSHEAIAIAIERGDSAQARLRMRKHFDTTLVVFGYRD
jgi:DNA-binding FadR family transcriptional regulator